MLSERHVDVLDERHCNLLELLGQLTVLVQLFEGLVRLGEAQLRSRQARSLAVQNVVLIVRTEERCMAERSTGLGRML